MNSSEASLALRSSGLYEDQQFSFAGQFLTKDITLEELMRKMIHVAETGVLE